MAIVLLFIVGSAIYYTFVLQKTLTHNTVLNTVLDTLVAILLEMLVVFIVIIILVLTGFLNNKRIDISKRLQNNGVTCQHGENCPYKIGNYYCLRFFDSSEIEFDCKDILNLKEMHPFISTVLRFTVSDKEGIYRSEVGSLIVPQSTLEELSKVGSKVVMKLGSASYYNIFFTHYFADYQLTGEQFDENSSGQISLRSLFYKDAAEYIHSRIEKYSSKNQSFSPYPLFPNPFGVTGICRYNHEGKLFYIRRFRTAAGHVTNEQKTLDWAFSGLVESHTLFDGGRETITLKEYFEHEMADELLKPLALKNEEIEDIIKNASSVPLGIIFSNRHLLQPELIILITLKHFSHHERLQDKRLHKILETKTYDDLLDEVKQKEEKQKNEKKEIYGPATLLLMEYLKYINDKGHN